MGSKHSIVRYGNKEILNLEYIYIYTVYIYIYI